MRATSRQLIEEYEAQLPGEGWPNWVLGNHDNHRIASRVGLAQARIAAMLLLTLRGTPTLYYGDEIGMCDVDIPHDRVQDPFEKNVPGKGLGRDPERTPMQWDATTHAGFTHGGALASDRKRLPARERARATRRSRLDPRALPAPDHAAPRRARARSGPVRCLSGSHDVLAYYRQAREGDASFLVALNLGSRPQVLAGTDETDGASVIVGTRHEREGEKIHGDLVLGPHEGVVLRLARESR